MTGASINAPSDPVPLGVGAILPRSQGDISSRVSASRADETIFLVRRNHRKRTSALMPLTKQRV